MSYKLFKIMNKTILSTLMILIIMSCGSGDKGELVGVKGSKYFPEKPFGMTLIPGGAFIMGKSDDDLVALQDAPTKTVSVSSFYMDETEITNSEYKQFLNWVRDSILRDKLAKITENGPIDENDPDAWANAYSYLGFNDDNGDDDTEGWNAELEANKDKKLLDWSQELIFDENDFPGATYKEIFLQMRILKEDTPDEKERWDPKEILFKYSDYDMESFLKLKSKGGYVYDVMSDKLIAVANLVEYGGWGQKEATDLVYNPSPLDNLLVAEQAYEEANIKMQNYFIDNDPDNFEQQFDRNMILYKKRFTKVADPKDFIRVEDLQIYPDTTVWSTDFDYSFNEKMSVQYFDHDAFSDYPVVGVTWKQAKAFCAWRTMYKNGNQKARNKSLVADFRLPTEAEWEYAARGGLQGSTYPWGGPYTKDDRGTFLANFKPLRGDYAVDCAFYTVEANSFEANDYGLYNMSGNVAEWVDSSYESDAYEYSSSLNPNVNSSENNKKITRGGSWKDVKYYLQVSTRDYEYSDKPRSYIGFRTVHDYLGTEIMAIDQNKNSRVKR